MPCAVFQELLEARFPDLVETLFINFLGDRSFFNVKRIVANIAAKEVGSTQAFYGDVLGRNCVGVLVECRRFLNELL